MLRGPQGTLYGRNSIGGVINYVTNQPNHDEFEASTKVMVGRYNTREIYGVISGPLTRTSAYRLTAVNRKRDGAIEGIAGSPDVEDVNDGNVALTLDWTPLDNIGVNLRVNDRRSLRMGNFGNGGHGITSEGPCVGQHPITSPSQCDPRYRVARDTNHYAPGFRPVSEDYYNTYGDLTDGPLGAVPWTHPTTGAIHYGAYNRPGVDNTDKYPYMPSGNYQVPGVALYDIGDAEAPDIVALTNGNALEEFDHQSGSLTLNWDVTPNLSIKYLGNYQQFGYYFNRDNDFSNGTVSDSNDTVREDVDSYSHELRVFWDFGTRWTATTGLYNFNEYRRQLYGIREREAQGRVSEPTNYGPGGSDLLLDALAVVGWIMPECMHYHEVPINGGPQVHPGYGAYCGDPAGATPYDQDNDGGAVYEHDNLVKSENLAFYTQGDLKLTNTLSVTLGFRYSKDDRWGLERRGGYSELNANDYSAWLPWAIACVGGGGAGIGCPAEGMSTIPGFATGWEVQTIPGVNWWEHFNPGVNGLAAMNVAMGNATYSGNPDFPITPTCSLTSRNCDHPLRLEGIPISWGSRISGSYEKDWDTTWRVNFNWEPSDNILMYFGATTGYRAGGWDMGGPDNRALFDADGTGSCVNGGDESGCDFRALLNYDGEDITSYEVGYKGTHLDGKLQVNVALYYYDYENYQDHVERWEESNGSFSLPGITLPGGEPLGPPPGRGPVAVTINIPQAVNKGFEIDGLYLLNDNFTFGGNYSYTLSEYDAPFTFFNEDDPRYPRNVFGGDLAENPCNMAPEIRALYCLEVQGFQLTGIPEHKATAWAAYSWYLAPGMLTLRGSVTYVGEYATHPFNRPWDIVPERERVDMRLSFREGSGRWEASLFVDNLMDETYIRDSDMSERLTGYGSNWPQRVIALYPRFWGAELTYNFGGAVR